MTMKRKHQETDLQANVLAVIADVLQIRVTDLDLHQSFVFHGGHSLTAIWLFSKCKQVGIYLSVQTILCAGTIKELLDIACSGDPYDTLRFKRHKTWPVMPHGMSQCPTQDHATLRNSVAEPSAPGLTIEKNSITNSSCTSSITEMQMTLISGSERSPGSNVIQFFDTFFTEHIPTMKQAWKLVVEFEPIFSHWQTSLFQSEAYPVISRPAFQWSDLSYGHLADYEAELSRLPADASVGMTFKAVTLEQQSKRSITSIVWNVHHALIDGYSAFLVYQKVRRAAEGYEVRPGTSFFEVARELRSLQQRQSSSYKAFWKDLKNRFPNPAKDVPLSRPSIVTSDDHQSKSLAVPLNRGQIIDYCRNNGVTVASLHYSAWSLVLSKYTDSDSIVFGAVVSGRSIPLDGVEDTIGPLINTLPLYVAVSRNQLCREYIANIFQQMIELESVQTSTPSDGYSRDFCSAMAMEVDIYFCDAENVKNIAPAFFRTVPDLPLTVLVRSDGSVRLIYRTERYSSIDMDLMSETYGNAVNLLMQPDTTIRSCMTSLIPETCRKTLLELSNCSSVETTRKSFSNDLVTLFETMVEKYGSATAVEKQNERLSYTDLDNQADVVRNQLRQLISPGEVVGVHVDRSVNWIVAIYGILKAGGVYAPFDPYLPMRIREENCQTASIRLYLVPSKSQKPCAPSVCETVLCIEESLAFAKYEIYPTHRTAPDPDAPAYVCFTSGSTGKPKGVLCHHGGLVAFQKEMEVRLFAEPGCKVAQVMSPAFDGSIHEIFSALSYGATLVLPVSCDTTAHLLNVTSAILTPSLAIVLDPEDYPSLSNVYLVGEPVTQQLNDIWARSKNLYNMYGPTESICGATIKRLKHGQSVTLGKPNPSCRVYILDRHRELCPIGVPGDIYVAGVQVARGYLNMPEETSKRFLQDTILPELEEKMYWTGDRGYWNQMGEIHYLGRIDRQIKLHGFRINLSVLEEQISENIPDVIALAVFQEADHLVVAVQPACLDTHSLKAKLKHLLPFYALPRRIIAIEAFPLTAAGKLDYSALLGLYKTGEAVNASDQLTETEVVIAKIWRDILLLGAEVTLTPNSNFLLLGGESISQLHLANRLSRHFKRQVRVKVIMETHTLRSLATEIDIILTSSADTIDALPTVKVGKYGVSAIEKEWVQKYSVGKGLSTFNVCVSWSFDRNQIDRQRLQNAWNDAISRYAILSSRFAGDSSATILREYHDVPPRAQCVEHIDIEKEVNSPFHLDTDHLARVLISEGLMLASISHIICDLTTLNILLKDVAALYLGLPLTGIARQYHDLEQISDVAYQSHLSFWRKYLQDPPPVKLLGRSIPSRSSYEGTSCTHRISSSLSLQIHCFADSYGFTLHQLALSAIGIVLQADSAAIDLVVGAPYLNRQPEDLDTVGLFLEPLTVRMKYDPTDYPDVIKPFLIATKQSSQSAVAHAVPWPLLLDHIGVVRDFPNHPLFDIMVTFHDDRHSPQFSVPGFRRLHTWSTGAKFMLMFEFCALSEEDLVLRVEYDTKSFTEEDIERLHLMLSGALDDIVNEKSFSGTRMRALSTWKSPEWKPCLQCIEFGSHVHKL